MFKSENPPYYVPVVRVSVFGNLNLSDKSGFYMVWTFRSA